MATLTENGYPTIVDVIRRLKPDGSVEQQIAELLAKKTPLLEDMPWVESNSILSHRVTSRLGLPSPKWRRANQGLTPSKSNTVQYDEALAMLEDYSNIDIAVANLGGNPAAYRKSEDKAFIEAFGEEIERAIFYESILTEPDRIHGLSPRYPATTGYTSSSYVLKGTNAGVNCHSLWLIDWNPEKVAALYPKGSVGGIQHKDMGEQLIQGTNGGQFRAFVSHFKWDAGLLVKDYRHAVRFQWDPDDANFADSAKGLYLAMQQMLDTIFDDSGMLRFYMNRTSRAKLNAQLASNDANLLTYIELGKRRVASFMGVPIRVTDTLVAETAIS